MPLLAWVCSMATVMSYGPDAIKMSIRSMVKVPTIATASKSSTAMLLLNQCLHVTLRFIPMI